MDIKSYIAGGMITAMLLTMSIFLPVSTPGSSAKASPAIPAILLQGISEAEQQCRIDRESCEINYNRCKANERYENQRTDQCRANVVRRYENCERRRLNTLAPLRGHSGARPSATQVQQYQQRAVIQACGRSPSRGELQKSCPARGGGCYSRGYCTQQYQRCSSNASFNNPPVSRPSEPTRVQTYTPPPPPVRSRPRNNRNSTGLKRAELLPRPKQFKVRITNPCLHPVKAAYAYNWGPRERDYYVWGWTTIPARGDTIATLPGKIVSFYIYLDKGKVEKSFQYKKLYINFDSDFRAGLNLDKRPAKPTVTEADYYYATGSTWMRRVNGGKRHSNVTITGCEKG